MENTPIRYLSLFTGIGGFEKGIHDTFPKAKCVAFSEIDPYAIQIYTNHYPDHVNLGDITKISENEIKKLGKIDLVVAGFPCTNLSSMASFKGDNTGLNGPKSGLFYNLVNVLKWVAKNNPDMKFIVENNNSMKKVWKEDISKTLQKSWQIFCNVIDNSLLGVQTRKRIIWTNFPFSAPEKDLSIQTWNDVLEPLENTPKLSHSMVECLNKTYPKIKAKKTKVAQKTGDNRYKFIYVEGVGKSRWDIHNRSDTMTEKLYNYPVGKSRPIMAGTGGGSNIVLDRRVGDGFVPRRFTILEIERLFGFPDNYTCGVSNTRRSIALGNSVPVFVVKHVLEKMKKI